MDNETFMVEVENSFNRSKRTLMKKEKEYSDGLDRLNQFYRAGTVQCIEPTDALIGMATKHFTSICDMAKNPQDYKLREWNEKIEDLRNYTFLLDALLRDMEVV
jgi:hypothetical protein